MGIVEQKPRQAIVVLETSLTEHGYVPSVVTENVAGHSPLTGQGECAQPWYWGHDLAKAKEIASDYNTRLGLTPEDVRDIVASSFAAAHEVEEFEKQRPREA